MEKKTEVLGKFSTSVFSIDPEDDLPEIFPKNILNAKNVYIDLEMVRTNLKNLKIDKSTGPDNISPRTVYLKNSVTYIQRKYG